MTEPVLHEAIEFSPPLNLNLVQCGGVGRYGCRRFRHDQSLPDGVCRQLVTWHQGIDLVSDAPDDLREVYAATWGVVESIEGPAGDQSLTLRHEPFASGYYTVYRHLENLQVSVGDDPRSGHLMGQYNTATNHLHFEWRRLSDLDPAAATPSRSRPLDTISLDPTPLLYRFEAEGWPRQRDVDIVRGVQTTYEKIDRLRVVSWRVKQDNVVHNTAWLFEVSRQGTQSDYFYLPITAAMPHEKLMIEVLRDAFNTGAKIRLSWRESHFFGERLMIEDVRVKT